ENAIDATATEVQLIVKDAGKTLIQVIDNGVGMSPTDARMCFERHATSKIKKSEDLFNISTMGFRGEAMASIAAVAQVELRTNRSEEQVGTLICIEGSILKKQEEIVFTKGTSIAVKNLFFNVPARRNFLKTNAVEMRHVLDEFQRVALANPEIMFSLVHNDLEVYRLTAGKLSHRIVGIFGKSYREQLIPCQEETPLIKVTGYIGKPDNAKKTRGEQFFFVNQRFIKSGYLHHAVMTAFEGLLPKQHYPFYTLFLEIDATHIDINVHPTKTEIKFDDERTVYAIINAAVRRALGTHNITPALDFDVDVNFSPSENEMKKVTVEQRPKEIDATGHQKTPREKANIKNWEKLFEGFQKDTAEVEAGDKELFDEITAPKTITLESSLNDEKGDVSTVEGHTESNLLQLHLRYIVTQVKSGLMVIDQHAAHQRILYDKYLATLQNKNGISQQLLFPTTVTLNSSDYELMKELSEELQALGFAFAFADDYQLVLQGLPAGVRFENEKEMLEGFIEQLKHQQASLQLPVYERMANSLAKRTAIRPNTKLSSVEMNTLVAQLFTSSNPNYTPSGEPTLVILDMVKLGEMFVNP
ncbi:MAG: DNA mismatch repair endonuclease MutL, partial [Bacteroidota bacterium]